MEIKNTFSSFSVPDMAAAKTFYGKVLGLSVTERPEGLQIQAGAGDVFVYQSADNPPAKYTILNFVVEDAEKAVDELIAKGVRMESYDMPELKTDDKGIVRGDGSMGPHAMAWFKDPAGNILSVLEE